MIDGRIRFRFDETQQFAKFQLGSGGFYQVDGARAKQIQGGTTQTMVDDSDRFEALALPHLGSCFRLARRLMRDEAEAEDLVQETYVRAFRAFDRFELRDHGVKPWLFRILHNVFYTSRAKSRRRPALLDDPGFDRFESNPIVEPPDPGIENIQWDAINEELKHAVDELQTDYRIVLLLWAFEDLSYKEIAEVCDCAVGTVMSRLYRARKLMTQKLLKRKRPKREPKKA